ncbi:response regulator [Trichormus sp. NMC-1]|uniref:response regulator n=1 Tax=Trichormus sp. NMC-1 TaxID=1853259 RepID=UPI0009F1C88D|nr:response regulator [Trichormus sp. NMC-1]
MLILDVEMPYTNGIELCQRVRSNSQWSELPILFFTVHNDAEMVNQVFSAGADDFVEIIRILFPNYQLPIIILADNACRFWFYFCWFDTARKMYNMH